MSLLRLTYLLACLLSLCVSAVPARAQNIEHIQSILEKAVAAPKDKDALKERLQELETALGGRTDVALGEYTRGWILSELGRNEESVASYDRATTLDPKMGDAWYNAGVLLSKMGRIQEAIEHYKETMRVDPSHTDAAYNLGQMYYNKKDFVTALDWWQKARTLSPEDFGVVKKVLQAQYALGRWEVADITREEVFRLHRESKDASIRALKKYCFDQFDVDKLHVFAYEIFEPAGEDAVLYTFLATWPDAKVWGEVTVVSPGKEPAKPGPRRLDVKVGGKKSGEPVRLESLPDYPALKERIRLLVRKHILPSVK